MILEWEDATTGIYVEFEVEVEFATYYPAKLSGPWENCYPAEGGEIEKLDIRPLSLWPGWSPCPYTVLGSRAQAYWKMRIEDEIWTGGQLYDQIIESLSPNYV